MTPAPKTAFASTFSLVLFVVIQISRARHGERPHLARLRRQPDRCIRRAKTLIIAPLDDLEEEPLVENVSVDLEELAIAFAVVENTVGAQRRHRFSIEVVLGLEVVVIIVRNIEKARTPRAHLRNGREDIGAGERDVLDARAEELGDE